mmetsp:Transcript_18784/g.54282  ORF Transcript_18784/g.54282 Transcript_18784/m.54282 type:complete len:239 (+) Transcript_18784:205-921(+)
MLPPGFLAVRAEQFERPLLSIEGASRVHIPFVLDGTAGEERLSSSSPSPFASFASALAVLRSAEIDEDRIRTIRAPLSAPRYGIRIVPMKAVQSIIFVARQLKIFAEGMRDSGESCGPPFDVQYQRIAEGWQSYRFRRPIFVVPSDAGIDHVGRRRRRKERFVPLQYQSSLLLREEMFRDDGVGFAVVSLPSPRQCSDELSYPLQDPAPFDDAVILLAAGRTDSKGEQHRPEKKSERR